MAEPPTSGNADGVYEPFHIDEVPWDGFEHGERFAMCWQTLSRHGGGSQWARRWRSCRRLQEANQPHYHLLEEELVMVLEGQLTLRVVDREHEMGPGHHVCFRRGRASATRSSIAATRPAATSSLTASTCTTPWCMPTPAASA